MAPTPSRGCGVASPFAGKRPVWRPELSHRRQWPAIQVPLNSTKLSQRSALKVNRKHLHDTVMTNG
jgi:hypothetical protein